MLSSPTLSQLQLVSVCCTTISTLSIKNRKLTTVSAFSAPPAFTCASYGYHLISTFRTLSSCRSLKECLLSAFGANLALLTKSRSAPPHQQKKTPSGVIRRVLSSVSGSMRSPTRGSGPPLPLSLVAKRALSCARASARKTSPRTRPAAVSAPSGIPGWNGVPGCAVGLPQSS